MSTSTPENLKYTSTHEWVREENGTITIGITEHAQSLLGDVVFVELPTVDKQLKTNEACAVIESVKAAADVYAPVAGKVISVNKQLETNPELINSATYEAGWICTIELADKNDLSKLITADAYRTSIEH